MTFSQLFQTNLKKKNHICLYDYYIREIGQSNEPSRLMGLSNQLVKLFLESVVSLSIQIGVYLNQNYHIYVPAN